MIDINEWMKLTLQERQSHLRLDESCLLRGGSWTQFRGVMVVFLNTTFPKGNRIHLCHACNNEDCSNPVHLYWGTAAENTQDAIRNGRKTTKGRAAWNKGLKRIKPVCRNQQTN
jgi:hypothetical protein